MARRNKEKYPALKQQFNLRNRKDYIEGSEYINGVYDEEGRQVIRALNDEEKRFLNNFYEETIITNFSYTPELKEIANQIRKIKNCSKIQKIEKIEKKFKKLNEKSKASLAKLKEEIKELNDQVLKDLKLKQDELRKKQLLFPDKERQKEFYGDNNARNRCLYTNTLEDHEENKIDTVISDDLSIEDMYYFKQIEKEYERLSGVMAEEKLTKSKKSRRSKNNTQSQRNNS